MQLNKEEIIERLSFVQPTIWQTVSNAVSENSDTQIDFENPLTLASSSDDVYGTGGALQLVVQFAFAHLSDSTMAIVIGADTVSALYSLLKGEEPETVDDQVVTDIRPSIEGIVQGVCLAVANMRNDPIVATGLSIRFQAFAPPPNFSTSEYVLRTNVAVSADGLSGTVAWLTDAEASQSILGLTVTSESASGPATSPVSGGGNSIDDASSLSLLMDIPLEISIELGRVKMQVKDVVDLGSGSIVEIDKAAGEPVDVLVNGRLVARGEVVVIEDNLGVRITEILSPAERLQRLNDAA